MHALPVSDKKGMPKNIAGELFKKNLRVFLSLEKQNLIKPTEFADFETVVLQ